MSESKSKWAELRDGFAAAREVLIVAAILALILIPSTVRSILEDAGIRAVAGIEFNTDSLDVADQELTDAQTLVADLQNKIAETEKAVTELTYRSNLKDIEMRKVSQLMGNLKQSAGIVSDRVEMAKGHVAHMQERIHGSHPESNRRQAPNSRPDYSPAPSSRQATQPMLPSLDQLMNR